MRNINTIIANDDWTLDVVFDEGVEHRFDVKPLLDCEAFESLRNLNVSRQFAIVATLLCG